MIKLDTVWMVVLPQNRGVVYEIGTTPREVWQNVIHKETMGTGHTQASLTKLGYRAKKVTISLPKEPV